VALNLDDIVVHRAILKSHDEHLHSVSSAMTKHHLTLNGEKSFFAAPAIEFVGFCLSADGTYPLHSNMEAIDRVQEPTSAAQVASFLGMTVCVMYYLRFLTQYSVTTMPLRKLLKQDEPWLWTPASSDTVRLLSQLTSPPVVAHFDLPSPTLVTHDASALASPTLAPGRDTAKHNLVQLLHTPLQEMVSLKELQDASASSGCCCT